MFVAAVCLQPDRSLRITCSERHGRSLLGMDLTRRWAGTTGIAFQACCRTAISIVVERSLDDLARRVHQHHTILTLFSVFNPLCNETKLRCLRFGPCLHNDLSSLSTPLLLFSCNIVAEWNIKVSLHFKKSSSVCEVICMKLRSFCLSEALRRLSVVYFEDKGAKSSIVSQIIPAGSPTRGGDGRVCVCDIYQPSLPTPFYSVLASISIFMALSTVFHSINSPDNSPFSHSVLPVLSLPYWSFQLDVSLRKSPSALI